MKAYIKKIFILLVMFVFTKVSAATSTIGQGARAVTTPCASGICWNHSVSSGLTSDHLEGIRISMVDANGNRIAGTSSINYARCETSSETFTVNHLRSNQHVMYTTSNMTKNEIINNYHRMGVLTPSRTFGNFNKIECLTGQPSGLILPKIYARPYGEHASTPLKNYFMQLASPHAAPNIQTFFKQNFLNKMGYDRTRYTISQLNNHYLLIEPFIYVRITYGSQWQAQYVGTVTEVVKMMTEDIQPHLETKPIAQQYSVYNLFLLPPHVKGSIYFTGGHRFTREIPSMIYVDGVNEVAGLQGVENWVNDSNYDLSVEVLTRNGIAAGHVKVNLVSCENLEYAKGHVPECCNELYYIHHMNGSVDIRDYLSLIPPTCCEPLKNIVPRSWYDTKCKSPVGGCDYKFDIQCPDNCNNETTGYIKDIGINNNDMEWDCIFKSSSSSKPRVRNHYQWTGGGMLGNPYCEIYCREEILYELPRGGMRVKAGHHFIVGERTGNSWHPIEFSGFQECRTKGNGNNMIINHEQFKRDYEYWDRLTENRWNDLQNAIALQNSIDAHTCSSVKDCDRRCVSWETVCTTGEDGVQSCRDRCTRREYFGYTCTAPTKYNGVYGPKNAGSWCSTSGTPSAGVSAKRSSFQSARNTRDNYLSLINKCNDWEHNYDSFKPEVYLQYEEAKYGFNFGEIRDGIELGKLKGTLVVNYKTKTYYSGKDYENKVSYTTSVVERFDCNSTGARCVKRTQVYPINDNRDEQYQKKYVYTLNNNVYRYITKPMGLSQHKTPVSSRDQYINIGYSNLPVHFSRLPGEYDIDLKYTSFGPNNKFNNYVFRGYNFSDYPSNYFKCNNIYECNYRVNNEFMYCSRTKCKDIQIIFRPVSLSHPFLTSTGANRRPGENWHNDVEKITENRNLSVPERIYSDRDPMYEITLNTALIGQIRKYNRDARGGYSDFNLECITGEGRECKSQFIRNTFNSSFVSRWCGMSSDWDRCEKDDE